MARLTQLFNKHAVQNEVADDRWVLPSHHIGYEFELENANPLRDIEWNNWLVVNDGSLRNEGAELISNGPVSGSKITKSLDEFFQKAPINTLQTNGRTGLHVHLNFSRDEDTCNQLRAFVATYFLVEDGLYRFADIDRKQSGYSWSLDAAPAPLLNLFAGDRKDVDMAKGIKQGSRYYGLNIVSLAKHGTVEFRHMPMVLDRPRIELWTNIIFSLRKYAQKYGDLNKPGKLVLDDFRKLGPEAFSREVFGSTWEQMAQYMDFEHMVKRADALELYVLPSTSNADKTVQLSSVAKKNPLLSKLKVAELKIPGEGLGTANYEPLDMRTWHTYLPPNIRAEGQNNPFYYFLMTSFFPHYNYGNMMSREIALQLEQHATTLGLYILDMLQGRNGFEGFTATQRSAFNKCVANAMARVRAWRMRNEEAGYEINPVEF